MRLKQIVKPLLSVLYLAIPIILFNSCKKDDPQPEKPFSVDIFYLYMSRLTLEVAYEPGAEPYDLDIDGKNLWKFAEMNIEALFEDRTRTMDVIVPDGINEMTAIPDQGQTSYTVEDIQDIASLYRTGKSTINEGNIYVLFLDGLFEQNDSVYQNIMGLHITGTTITAIFKPLIKSANTFLVVRQFVEQSVVIHEVGHSLGLVNNGVPAISAHHDEAHKAHCTNEDCVMYWQNERKANYQAYVQYYQSGEYKVMFGDECLQDTNEYQP